MSEETKVVETKTETATVQQEATVNAAEVDYEAVLAQKDAELAQVRTERENYRKGMLKAKGKPVESSGDEEDETQEDMVRRVTREELSRTKEAQLQSEKDALIAKTLKRNKELEVALKNRGQILSTSAQGSNKEKPEGKADSYFSNDQIQALKAKGWSDKKIEAAKQNILKSQPK